ncbi:hypothetical protein QOZ80_2AG0137030 [Eleusine coracana subsp. coracana]|nr:hypothetical protein QOZ80_2AG0137030 [Eleusine coracana subsp. coracana]
MSSAATATVITMKMQLMLLLCLGALPQRASRAAGGILAVPSAASLAHCPTSCGNATFLYPFGTAPGCFRQGFELTCDDTTHPPRLFWANSTTQMLGTDPTDHYFAYASIGSSITMTPGTTTYTRSWESPAKGFILDSDTHMYVVGCDVEVVLFDTGTNLTVGSCTSICFGNMANMSVVPVVGQCNGLGCCSIALPEYLRGFRFTLSRRRSVAVAETSTVKVFLTDQYEFDESDLYSNWINSSVHTSLEIFATDQPSCEDASANKETYACSPGSSCRTGEQGGYFCYCNPSVGGNNPYVLDGCIEGYNPNPRGNCWRSCGNMSIPFPFGLEEGGFVGNPYVKGADGCTDIDECLDPNVCDGICHNTQGGYYCTSCPHGTVFEPTKRKCVTSAKQHNILLGTTIGIGCGLGSIICALCGTILAGLLRKQHGHFLICTRLLQYRFFTET